MGNRKYVLNTYLPYEVDGLTDYFSEMSEQGWMIDYLGFVVLGFKKCEPKKRKFQIYFAEDAAKLGYELQGKAIEYKKSIESIGYDYITNRGQMMLFVSDDLDLPDVIEEGREKLKNLHGYISERWLIIWGVLTCAFLPVVGLMTIGSEFSQTTSMDILEMFWKHIMEFDSKLVPLAVATLFGLLNIVMYNVWHGKVSKKIEYQGNELYASIPHVIYQVVIVIALVILLMVVVKTAVVVEGVDLGFIRPVGWIFGGGGLGYVAYECWRRNKRK